MKIEKSAKIEDRVMKRSMQLFGEQAVKYFGIDKKVKSIGYTEQPKVVVEDSYMDYVFEMEDGSYCHFEFQSSNSGRKDYVRFCAYDVNLTMSTGKNVTTYVIYSSNIKNPTTEYNFGNINYKVNAICMSNTNADPLLRDIDRKLENGEELSDTDMMNLIFSPLMDSEISKFDRIVKAIEISKENSSEKSEDILSLIYAFGIKFLQGEEFVKMMEVFKMTTLGRMLVNDGIKQGISQGISQGLEQGLSQGLSQGRKEGIEFGIKGSLSLLSGLKLPKAEIREQLYKTYSDSKDLVDEILADVK